MAEKPGDLARDKLEPSKTVYKPWLLLLLLVILIFLTVNAVIIDEYATRPDGLSEYRTVRAEGQGAKGRRNQKKDGTKGRTDKRMDGQKDGRTS